MASPPSPALAPEILARLDVIRGHIRAKRVDQAGYGLSKLPPSLTTAPEVIIVGALYEYIIGHQPYALQLAGQAYRAAPDHPDIVADYASILWNVQKRREAIELLSAHHERYPAQAAPIRLLSDYFNKCGMGPQAAALGVKLAELEPDTIEASFVRANTARDLRQYDAALGYYEEACARSPFDLGSVGGRLFTMLYAGKDPVAIRQAAEGWCARAFASVPRATLHPTPLGGGGAGGGGGRKLRIGYVSADFRQHVVAHFIEAVLAAHDHSRVTVACYSNVEQPDVATERFKASADLWREIRSMSDESAAALIREDKIDVLIDLSGHTEGNRLGVFARRAAPAQATYLGFPATTGLAEMDFRITDAVADPPWADAFCTERLYRLPRCAWAFKIHANHDPGIDPSLPGPAGRGEPFTFGSFNLLTKVSQSSTALWGRALAACGDKARLLMTDRRGLLADAKGVEILTREFADAGADLARVMLASWMPDPRQQTRRLLEVDLMLDPLTYNGTTTTCEALWNGVPTLTLPGTSHVARVGASLLTAMGLENLIARDEADFIAKATAFANDPTELKALRPELRRRLMQSDLGNPRSLASALEDACVEMYQSKL